MGIAYKNFWSLNTDEAVAAGILRYHMPKEHEVFMPLNAQSKGIDLLLVNLKNKKFVSIQVKGSRAYESSKKESLPGSAGWFMFKKDVILKASADWFIYLIYVIEEEKSTGRRYINPHVVTISTKDLKNLFKQSAYEVKGGRFNQIIWINPKDKKAFDIHNSKHDFSKWLDKEGIEKLKRAVR